MRSKSRSDFNREWVDLLPQIVVVVAVAVVESQEHRPLVLWDRTAGPINVLNFS